MYNDHRPAVYIKDAHRGHRPAVYIDRVQINFQKKNDTTIVLNLDFRALYIKPL